MSTNYPIGMHLYPTSKGELNMSRDDEASPAAMTTARWWADHLRRPPMKECFEILDLEESIDLSKGLPDSFDLSATSSATIIERLRARDECEKLGERKIHAFEVALAVAIDAAMGSTSSWYEISTTSRILVAAARRAGFTATQSFFPGTAYTRTKSGAVKATLHDDRNRTLPLLQKWQ
ncbi:MAG: hypothetical protein ACRD63_11255 [Pyrinomonadaceae bacterium]